MSQRNALAFLTALRADPAMLSRYAVRNLSQVLFHAKNEGFDFTREDIHDVVSKLEASVILNKDHDAFDGTAGLWRRMWGCRYLDYIVTHVVMRHTDAELDAL